MMAAAVMGKTPLEQDVILGSETNAANKLLGDLICLHRSLEGHDAFKAQPILDLMKEGISVKVPYSEERKGSEVPNHNYGPSLLQGPTNFWKKEGQKWVVMLDDEIIAYLEALNEAQATTETQLLDTKGLEDPVNEETPIPKDEDIKLVPGEEAPGSLGAHVDAAMINDKDVTYLSSNEMRVRVAIDALKRCQTFKPQSRFLLQDADDKEKWRVLSKVESGDLVLLHVFEKMRDQFPIISALANVPIVPTGEVELPKDFSKPGTIPIDAPSRYDVLFGRGGMTNNHPGNRRFRDIISLHRPDYVRAIKIEKPNVARRIVAAIRTGNPPGRFLKKSQKDLKWYDVGNRTATEKTSQALREKTSAEKNGKVSTEGDVRKRLLEQALYEARMTRMRLSKDAASLPAAYMDPTGTPGVSVAAYLPITPGAAAAASETAKALAKPSDGTNDTDEDTKPAAVKLSSTMVGTEGLTPEELKKVQERKQELADLAAKNDQEDPPSNDRGEKDSEGNIVVTENDILCGRGGLTNHHKGNKRFRDIVALHRADYVRAPKVHKPAVARLIVRAIRNSDPPGRFLKKDPKTGKWFDIGDKRASEKASQALREKSPEERVRLKVDAVTAVPLGGSFQANTNTGMTAMLMVPPVGAGLPTIQQVPTDQITQQRNKSELIVPTIVETIGTPVVVKRESDIVAVTQAAADLQRAVEEAKTKEQEEAKVEEEKTESKKRSAEDEAEKEEVDLKKVKIEEDEVVTEERTEEVKKEEEAPAEVDV